MQHIMTSDPDVGQVQVKEAQKKFSDVPQSLIDTVTTHRQFSTECRMPEIHPNQKELNLNSLKQQFLASDQSRITPCSISSADILDRIIKMDPESTHR